MRLCECEVRKYYLHRQLTSFWNRATVWASWFCTRKKKNSFFPRIWTATFQFLTPLSPHTVSLLLYGTFGPNENIGWPVPSNLALKTTQWGSCCQLDTVVSISPSLPAHHPPKVPGHPKLIHFNGFMMCKFNYISLEKFVFVRVSSNDSFTYIFYVETGLIYLCRCPAVVLPYLVGPLTFTFGKDR